MHIHILGICGKFMSGLAIMAKHLGHDVSGSDKLLLQPLCQQLNKMGISVYEGYKPQHLSPAPDCVVIGNVLSRGNPSVEHVLNEGIAYTSAAAWLAKHVLQDRWVLAVSGTHGKTTASSILAWLLEACGLNPGFLIGGMPENFGFSARVTDSTYFVLEADEYDTAFFDKRPKFMHFKPQTLIINNIEFDHADIYPDLAAIKQQFHYLVRTVPAKGQIIYPSSEDSVKEVIEQGCWSNLIQVGEERDPWTVKLLSDAGDHFEVQYQHVKCGEVKWPLLGLHNIHNALVALAAAHHCGIEPEAAVVALNQFKGVEHRLQIKGQVNGVTVYDDFAHHPTAIKATLNALRNKVGAEQIIAVIDFASSTMRSGIHHELLQSVFVDANRVLLKQPQQTTWQVQQLAEHIPQPTHVYDDVEQIIADIKQNIQEKAHVLIMSNQQFDQIHDKLLAQLSSIPNPVRN